jgi:hypothetical protein
VYEQIARNRRCAVLYVVVFFAVWVAIGALVALIFEAGAATAAPTSQGARAVFTGMVVAALFAIGAIIISVSAGTIAPLRARSEAARVNSLAAQAAICVSAASAYGASHSIWSWTPSRGPEPAVRQAMPERPIVRASYGSG